MSVPLLTEAEIQSGLESASLKYGLPEIRLSLGGCSSNELNAIRELVGGDLPHSYARLLSKYDFDFTVGQISFSNAEEVLWSNAGDHLVRWWGEGQRPHGQFMVASTDGYALGLDRETGRVWADGLPESLSGTVATDFDLLFRGAGSLWLGRDQHDADTLADRIAAAVGGRPEFWRFLAL